MKQQLIFILVALYPLWTYSLTLQSPSLKQCIPQYPPAEGKVPTAVYADCIRAIMTWAGTQGRNKPTRFSRNPEHGYQVPHSLVWGECVFEIDVITSRSEEVITVKDVAKEAGLLAKECVLNGEHTGGVAFVGPSTQLEIILHGRAEQEDKPLLALPGWEHFGGDGYPLTNDSKSMLSEVAIGTSRNLKTYADNRWS